MQKYEILNKIKASGIVAVVRGKNEVEAYSIIRECIDGGITAIELTFTVPYAHELLNKISKDFSDEIVIGAGSVLDSETARVAILNGAKFIVSPGFDEQSAKLCNRYAIPYIPGIATVTEAVRAMESGADVVKLFPGELFGPAAIKALKGPLPQANIMPTGGVSLENVGEWVKAGAFALGVGSALTKNTNDISSNSVSSSTVKHKAQAFLEEYRKANY